jgi:Carboxypeptidase regulatory-like domain
VTAGVVSITGALLSFTGSFKPAAAGTGKLVAIVQDRNNAAVGDATVEVLTTRKAVVTTLAANARGRASVPIEPGAYILQVRHPRLGSETRMVEVRSGVTAEIRVSLRGSVSAAMTSAAAAPVTDPPPPGPASALPAASPATEPRVTTEPRPSTPGRGGAQAP